MKKWFYRIKNKKYVHIVMWVLWLLIPCVSPKEGDLNTICMLLWLVVNVLEIIFIVWHVKYNKEEKLKKDSPQSANTHIKKDVVENKPISVVLPINTISNVNTVKSKVVKPTGPVKYNLGRQLIFVDVETANSHNDTICSIGMIIINKTGEIKEIYSLINPECEFSSINISIHKIKPEHVIDSPTFEEFWNTNRFLFDEDAVFAAHNTRFDLSVIVKDLNRYYLEFYFNDYIDTMELAKKYYYNYNTVKGDLKLDTLCSKFDIDLTHHNALSDIKACKEIFDILLSNYRFKLEDEIHKFNETDDCDGFVGSYQSGNIIYQGDYAKCIFLQKFGNIRPTAILSDDQYPNYLYRSLGIKNGSIFHKKMIDEGYLIETPIELSIDKLKIADLKQILVSAGVEVKGKKEDLLKIIISSVDKKLVEPYITEKTYITSEKGKNFIELNKVYVLINKYEWGITWKDIVRERKTSTNDMDIIWKIFNKELLDEPNYCRNTYYHMYQFLLEEEKESEALLSLLRVIYLDITGYNEINNYKKSYYFKPTKQEMYDRYDLSRELAPGLIPLVAKLKEYYSIEMVDKVYTLNHPVNVFTKEMFNDMIVSINDGTFDLYNLSIITKDKWIAIVDEYCS